MTTHIDTLTPVQDLEWTPLPGCSGVHVRPLSSTFDEGRRTGRRTRLVRFEPGAATHQTAMHEYHEETLLVSGDLEGFAAAVDFGRFTEQAYVHRLPGTPHGPVRSRSGCTLVEIHYFD